MRLLLDTHIFFWCIRDDRRLSKSARSKITQANEVYVSAASIWEAAIKVKLKKLDADIETLSAAVAQSGFLDLPITSHHASLVSRLPEIHKDPFDRMLIAQAIYEPLTFLTADLLLKKYSELVEIV